MEQKKGFIKGALCGALIMLLATGIVATGISYKKAAAKSGQPVDKKTEVKLNFLQELIDDKYLKAEDIDQEKMRDYLIKGYVSGLGDPYSVYYNEQETKELMESTEGEYSGIGVAMSQDLKTGIITFVNVYEEAPAAEAGFKNDDILYKVDGEDVSGQDLSKIVTKIKGEEGTKVTLTVIRGAEKKEYEAAITRRKIETHTIEYEMKADKIGYVRVTEFDSVTYGQFEAALNDLKKQGMKGLVVDLRSNPGGNLRTVCKMLDLILPEGTIVYTEDRNGERETMKSDAEHYLDIPMSVLVDGRSASASEIFAGAVQDYEVATIVGTTTYGKGIVQQLFPLTDGTCLKLTISAYYTPDGRSIHEKGIEPDVKVEYQVDEKNPDADNQLDKALEVTKDKIK